MVDYWARSLRKIGLRARFVPARRRPQTWLAASAPPELPHPALFFSLVSADDPLLDVDVERLRLLPLDASAERGWAKLDARVVDRAYVAPFGSATDHTFLSERLDFANCTRFNPVYGNDYSSFCLR